MNINNSNNNSNNNLKLSYNKDKIQELLNIINTMPFIGITDAMKLMRIFEILNEPFNLNKQFPNPTPVPKEVKEEKK
ncbi:MAG: hypothetical protein PHT02_00260 [Tissierellia bacterium]|nr:hypothetical protein [Tissierellia bacterium]